jgi:hypothetical protein
MGSDGPPMMSSLATWLHHNESSNAQTNASVHGVQGTQKLTAILKDILT